MMDDISKNLFNQELLLQLEKEAEDFCRSSVLFPLFEKGVVVALSGGADSVFLLSFLHRLSNRLGFSVAALHVNHGIRGAESDADEAFCQELCGHMQIPFYAVHISIPEIIREEGGMVEETARRERYRIFNNFLKENPTYSYLATAHTASDNLETVLFNLARGTGLRGVCGIPPHRDSFIRPLLSLNGQDIRRGLQEAGQAFVIDSTNSDTSYRRNYIREFVTPAFLQIHQGAEKAVSNFCRHASCDEEYLTEQSLSFLDEYCKNDILPRDQVSRLHDAVLVRVLHRLYALRGGIKGLENIHFISAKSLILSKKKNGRVDFPDSLSLCVEGNRVFVQKSVCSSKDDDASFYRLLSKGENYVEEFDIGVTLLSARDDAYLEKLKKQYSVVYQIDISNSYRGGHLFLRSKENGDCYRYGGQTHKVKKLFSDAKIPLRDRQRRLLLCDEHGILWVPGFPLREKNEHQGSEQIYVYFFMDGGSNE